MGTARDSLGLASLGNHLYAAGGYQPLVPNIVALATAERYVRRNSAEQLFYIF